MVPAEVVVGSATVVAVAVLGILEHPFDLTYDTWQIEFAQPTTTEVTVARVTLAPIMAPVVDRQVIIEVHPAGDPLEMRSIITVVDLQVGPANQLHLPRLNRKLNLPSPKTRLNPQHRKRAVTKQPVSCGAGF